MRCEGDWEGLANAIILQAIYDWQACEKNEHGEYVHPKAGKVDREEIKSFFRSDWFKCLSSVDPEYIIKALEKGEKCS